jgi:hypothetical protein
LCVVIGLIMLPYGLIKGSPWISMEKAIATVAIIALIIYLLTSYI